MRIVDVGSGPPIVIVPGIQGRWEWMEPAVAALARRCRVITFSLADEPSCGGRFDAEHGFDCYVEQIAEAMERVAVASACICGVSYGGLVAAAFAARHPRRTAGLVLVSALPPTWQPDARVRFYLRAPRLLSPLFFLNSLRLHREIAAATPGGVAAIRASARHGLNVLAHMLSPARMARRVRLLGQTRLAEEIRSLSVPTLVVTGEAELDRVVPVRLTEEYLRICRTAERVTIHRTGHLGLITCPFEFADAVAPFAARLTGGDHDAGSPGEAGRDERRARERRLG